ncbi:PfkB family carbohydrate kinase [Pseudomonas sp. G.S.17]|uniref:PfkB family carbohydrate kinase n=1 Tax=Pseudomonas sp. G.S.17 TaxID=3137451 RepID=UPI00311C9968
MPQLIAVGDNTVDVYLHRQKEYPGGNALNVAVFAARLGARSAYLGCVGDDDHGRWLLEVLKAESVDVSRCRTLPGASAWACVDSMDGERVFLGSDSGVCHQLHIDSQALACIAAYPLAHTSLYSGLQNSLAQIRQASGVLSFDFSDNWDEYDWRALIAHVDIAFFSAADLDSEAARQLASSMLALGPKVVVVTRGAHGALALDDYGFREQVSLPCEVVDSMGAGDGFIAAFLLAWQGGASLAECLLQGVDFAAHVCAGEGGFGHGQTLDPVRCEQLKQALKAQG